MKDAMLLRDTLLMKDALLLWDTLLMKDDLLLRDTLVMRNGDISSCSAYSLAIYVAPSCSGGKCVRCLQLCRY